MLFPTDDQEPVQLALDTRMTPCPTWTGWANPRRQQCRNGRLDTRRVRPMHTGKEDSYTIHSDHVSSLRDACAPAHIIGVR